MATVLSALALGACSSLQGEGVRTYRLPPGVATYDALRQATETCIGQGGALELRATGSSERLGDYLCRIDKPSTTPTPALAAAPSEMDAMLSAGGADVFGIKASGTSLKVEGYTDEQVGEVQACLQSSQGLDGINQCFKARGLSAVASIDNNGPRGAIEFDTADGRPTAADMAMLNRCVAMALPSEDGRVLIDSPANLASINACLRANSVVRQVVPGSLN